MGRLELVGWGIVAVVLTVGGIPWFLWGSDAVVYGLPVWLWWHVGWMVLASLVFWLFANRAWGIGIEPERDVNAGDGEVRTDGGGADARTDAGGERP